MKINNETKVGVLTALSITILVLGYNFLNGRDVFSSNREFVVQYPVINGLKVGNPIIINGYNIGRVREIDLRDDGKLNVTYGITADIAIPKDSRITIKSLDLLGAKGSELYLGKSTSFAEEGDTLLGDLEQSLTESVNEQVAPVKAKAEKLLGSMDSLIISLQSVLTPKFRKDIAQSVSSVNQSLIEFESSIGRLNTITKNVESITANLKNNNQRINDILANADKISDSLATSNLKQAVNNANRALIDFAEISEKINKGQGSLGMLVNNKALYENLNQSAADLDKIMVDLKANPKRYVSFSVFGGGAKKANKKAAAAEQSKP